MIEFRHALCVVCFALFATSAAAQDAPDIVALENELTAALLARDAAALDELWSEDLTFIARSGAQTTKAQRIAGQQDAGPPAAGESNVNDSVEVRVYGETAVAVVTSTWTIPPAAPGRYRALHVWRREGDGVWRLVAAQVASIS